MCTLKLRLLFLTLAASVAAPAAHAQWAVVDVGAIAQLIEQVRVMSEQLTTAQDQLNQARAQYEATTGNRGMEGLLRNFERNYLPSTWEQVAATMRETQGAHDQLAAELRAVLQANAVLSPAELAGLSPELRADLETTRRTGAMLQAIARHALATTSRRFSALEELIDAIPRATDQKAALELQARIGAEAAMLSNEQTKLQLLQQAAQAEVDAHQQRLLERSIADIGSLRSLPPLGL